MQAAVETFFLLSLVEWRTVFVSLLGNYFIYKFAPYILCHVWKDYHRVKQEEKCDFNMRLSQAISAVISVVLGVRAFFYEKDMQELKLVGASKVGCIALDLVIGQFLAEFVYHYRSLGNFGSIHNILHHICGIVGAIVSHHYFHQFAVYRFIHEVTQPIIMVFVQMHMVNYDTNSAWYKIVARINLCIYIFFRMVVIPFHWWWFHSVIKSAQSEWSDVWIVAWPLFYLSHAAVDCIDFYWGRKLIQIYRKVSRTWTHEE